MNGFQSNQHQFLLHKGWVSVKKGLIPTKRFAALCAPATVADIQSLYEFLFVTESETPVPMDERAIPWLGSIAFSAVRGMPFLVLMQSDSKTDRPEFVQLDSLAGISDEITIGSACTFALHLARFDIKFQCHTSTDYQDWMQALEIAYGIIHSSLQDNAMRQSITVGLESAVPLTQSIPRSRTSSFQGRGLSISRDETEELMKRASAVRQSVEYGNQNRSFDNYSASNSQQGNPTQSSSNLKYPSSQNVQSHYGNHVLNQTHSQSSGGARKHSFENGAQDNFDVRPIPPKK